MAVTAVARGRRIAFLDDDDRWAEPDHLERVLAKADNRGHLYASDSNCSAGGAER